MSSHAEFYEQIKKSLGVQSLSVHNFDLTGPEYKRIPDEVWH